MAPALLTAIDSTAHVHLVIGSNSLAGARCTRSIEVGAKPILFAPEDAPLHFGLTTRIDTNEITWLKRAFKDDDLTTLGREDVDRVVDAVFITLGGKDSLSEQDSGRICRHITNLLTRYTYLKPL
jgi:uroporphyrin-III C-methyltransferase